MTTLGRDVASFLFFVISYVSHSVEKQMLPTARKRDLLVVGIIGRRRNCKNVVVHLLVLIVCVFLCHQVS